MKRLATLALVALLPGCAYLASTTETRKPVLQGTNIVSVPVGKTTMRGYSLFSANMALQKAANQSDNSGSPSNQYSPGTRIAGLSQEANMTNVTQIVRIVVEAAPSVAKAAAGVP